MDEPTLPQLLAEPDERQILGLRLEHHVEVAVARDLVQEALEAGGVHEVGVRAQLGKHQTALDPPPACPTVRR